MPLELIFPTAKGGLQSPAMHRYMRQKKTRRLTSQLSSQIESDTYISTNVCNKAAGKLLSTYISHIVASQCHQTKKVLFGFVSSRLCCEKRLQGEILSGKGSFPHLQCFGCWSLVRLHCYAFTWKICVLFG